jgi:hypothetical protein
MKGLFFWSLLLLGSGGVLLSFLRARSRAVLALDGLTTPARRSTAMFLLAVVLLLTVVLPFAGGFLGTSEPAAPSGKVSLVSLFGVHVVLALFLVCYYFLSGHRSVADFLRLKSVRPGSDLASGVAIGGGVWLLNLVIAIVGVAVWQAVSGGPGEAAGAPKLSPMIVSIATAPVAIRVGVVVSAMFVEEFFFRSFLQTRVGPLAATLMFTAAHGVYGQPLLLVWILIVSTALSAALALYRNVLPCIVAHGVFDAIQMFLVIPIALKALKA